MILITGATGHVGSALLAELAARGETLRAMTRKPESARFPRGVEAVKGDFDDPQSLRAALEGVDRVFLMSAQPAGSAPAPTQELALVEACRELGVRRIVKLSALGGGSSDANDAMARWVQRSEQAVIESGSAWTLLRPGRFMSNALAWAPMLRAGDEVKVPLADRPAASIDPADVAAVAALALTSEGHDGRVYELSGPEVLTPKDELQILARALGRSLRLIELPIRAMHEGMLRFGMSEEMVAAALRQVGTDHGAHVLPTFQTLLGRAPRSFAAWTDAHLEAFR